LPRGAAGAITEEDLPADPDVLLDIGIEHFNAGRYFQAHEAWETAWHPSPDAERDFWQGITQIAVGFTHRARGNARGAVTLLRRGAARLGTYGAVHRGFPVAELARAANDTADSIERTGLDAPVTIPSIQRAQRT
jgi:predicted metal-dependent hydrolase